MAKIILIAAIVCFALAAGVSGRIALEPLGLALLALGMLLGRGEQ